MEKILLITGPAGDAQGWGDIEVNDIPGLKPIKSWSPQIFTMHHPSAQNPMEELSKAH